jgi:hypothetical protein
MKVAIMQPYFFPYLGYFDQIHNVDLFVIYDTVQYIKQGWINRNRILHPGRSGWCYIIVPMDSKSFNHSYKTNIVDVKISKNEPWKEHIVAQLAHYRKTAPYFRETDEFVKECLEIEQSFISKFNAYILQKCADLIGINFQYEFCSNLNVKLDEERTAEQRILDICQSLGATEYVNLPGGVDLYHPYAFERRGIKLTFRKLPLLTYPTGHYTFEPNLSIIDVLMWNRSEDIKRYLDDHKGRGNDHA